MTDNDGVCQIFENQEVDNVFDMSVEIDSPVQEMRTFAKACERWCVNLISSGP
jgi:hypothetical protein